MELKFNQDEMKYQVGNRLIESGFTIEVYDEISDTWFKGKVGYNEAYEHKYYITLMTCGGGELGQSELKYYSEARIA
jgi:hypothetical protein